MEKEEQKEFEKLLQELNELYSQLEKKINY